MIVDANHSKRSGTTLVRMTLYIMVPLTILLVMVVLVSQSVHHTDMQKLVGERNLRVVKASSVLIESELSRSTSDLAQYQNKSIGGEKPINGLPDENFPLGVYSYGCDSEEFKVLAQPAGDWQVDQNTLPIQEMCSGSSQPTNEAIHYYFGDVQKRQILWITSDGAEQSRLIAGLDLGQKLDRLLALPLGQNNLAILVYDSEHTLRYATGERRVGEHSLYHQGILSGLHGSSGVLLPGGGHQAHIISYTPVNDAGWILVMDESWDDASNLSLNISQSIPLILIPVVILFFVLFLVGYRQIVKPLQLLQQKASSLRQGDEQALIAEVGGMQEIRSLQTVLRDMSGELLQSRNNLAGYAGGLTAAIEAEKKELARELHDDSLQDLIAIKQLAAVEKDIDATEMNARIKDVIQKLRSVIKGLRPPYLDDLGLITALQVMSEEKTTPEVEIAVIVEGEEIRFSPSVELAFYRIAQEALTNSIKHARAHHVWINLLYEPDSLTLRIADDGVGFVVPDRLDKLAADNRYGLLGMKERAEQVGFHLSVQSDLGNGTRIEVSNTLRN